MNPYDIIDKYYQSQPKLYKILTVHSESVAKKALQICDNHPEWNLDRIFLYEAAMLHDIGIFKTNAPGIECYGNEPYIMHGYLGGLLLRSEGLSRHARVAERHTGTGLTIETIQAQGLPVPLNDWSPQTLEEIIICYADKFFSKSKLDIEKSPENVIKSLKKFGETGVAIFSEWHELFG